MTLLHHAAQNDCLESTIYLITAGANIHSLTIDGYSPCDIAKINKASITNLSAISANIGHFKSAATGARLEIKDSLLSV